MSKTRGRDLVAAVTVYRPDRSLLIDLVGRLTSDGLDILIYIDGATGMAVDADLLSDIQRLGGVSVIQAETNLGLGAGLNRLAAEARALGYRRILFFDQDSAPTLGLATELSKAADLLTAAGYRPAAVGPRLESPQEEIRKAPRYVRRRGLKSAGDLVPVTYVITSGSLVDLDAYEAVGPFRNDYWIDAIDTEWSFRAWHEGYSIWLVPGSGMTHRVGLGVLHFGPLTFPLQSRSRMYTYFRNQAHGLRLAHVPLLFKMRLLIYLPLQAAWYLMAAKHRRKTAQLLAAALRHGYTEQLGDPRRITASDD